jgi:hypothetical protein
MAVGKTMQPQREVTGYDIREAINRWRLRKQVMERQFRDAIYAFKGQEKPKPDEAAKEFTKADRYIALLEDLRQNFNQQVKVRITNLTGEDEEMTLSVAVKLFGGSGRLEKLWRDSCHEPEERYGRYDRQVTRSAGDEHAERRISVKDTIQKADEAARYASQLRTAISVANGNRIAIPRDFPPDVLG